MNIKILYPIGICVAVLIMGYAFLRRGGDAPNAQIVPEPSQESRASYVGLVEETAIFSQSISITNCVASPLVTKVKLGSAIEFDNRDAATHTIAFSPAKTFDVAGRGKKKFRLDYELPGIRKYSCDGNEGGVVLFME